MAETTPFTNASGQSYVQNYDFNPYATIRTLPVQDWVQTAISNAVYATDPSLQIRVSSGGQTSKRDPAKKNKPGGWTGSARHDEGGAADFSLVRNGEKLPIRGNEALYQSVARNLAAQGVPGIGVDLAAGYIHAGGGDQAAWGYQGQSTSSKYLPESFASAITEGRQLYGRGTGIPMPPAEIPNVVASAVDVAPPPPVAPVTPSTMPPMLAAQRNLQPVTQDTASLYAGIYPSTPPRQPITDKDLIFDRGIADTVDRTQAEQNRDLGAALGTYAQNRRAPSPMSYAAADRGPRSIASVPLPRPRPENLFGMNGDPGTPAQGAFVPLTPPVPRQLPPLPPAARDAAPRMTTAQTRADNGQTGNRQRVSASGIGQPPATRSVPSVPVPAAPAMGMTTDRGAMPTRSAFLSEFGLANPRETVAAPLPTTAVPGPSRVGTNERLGPGIPVASATAAGLGQLFPPTPYYDVGTALDVVPNAVPHLPIGPSLPPPPVPRPLRSGVNVQMPTQMGQRPTLPMPRSVMGFPTALAQRPNPNALRVTVQGAGSYNAPSRAPTPTREQMLAAIRERSRGPTAFGHGGVIDGAVQPIGTLTGRR